jgi:hypothetical protein
MHEWLTWGPGGEPAAHHVLLVDGSLGVEPRGPLAWSADTWPALVWPETPAGRGFGVDAARPALRLIEHGRAAGGALAVQHEVVVLAERTRSGRFEVTTASQAFG